MCLNFHLQHSKLEELSPINYARAATPGLLASYPHLKSLELGGDAATELSHSKPLFPLFAQATNLKDLVFDLDTAQVHFPLYKWINLHRYLPNLRSLRIGAYLRLERAEEAPRQPNIAFDSMKSLHLRVDSIHPDVTSCFATMFPNLCTLELIFDISNRVDRFDVVSNNMVVQQQLILQCIEKLHKLDHLTLIASNYHLHWKQLIRALQATNRGFKQLDFSTGWSKDFDYKYQQKLLALLRPDVTPAELGPWKSGEQFCANLLERFHHMQVLTITVNSYSADLLVDALLSTLPKLTKLIVRTSTIATTRTPPLSTRINNSNTPVYPLTELSLVVCRIRVSGNNIIAQHCPNLKRLDICHGLIEEHCL